VALGLILLDLTTDCGTVFGVSLVRAWLRDLDDVCYGLKLAEIAPDRVLGIQAHFARVRSQEAAQEDPPRQLVHLVVLDRPEDRDADLRSMRELIEGEPSLLARIPQRRTDIHGIRPRGPSGILPLAADRGRQLADALRAEREPRDV